MELLLNGTSYVVVKLYIPGRQYLKEPVHEAETFIAFTPRASVSELWVNFQKVRRMTSI